LSHIKASYCRGFLYFTYTIDNTLYLNVALTYSIPFVE